MDHEQWPDERTQHEGGCHSETHAACRSLGVATRAHAAAQCEHAEQEADPTAPVTPTPSARRVHASVNPRHAPHKRAQRRNVHQAHACTQNRLQVLLHEKPLSPPDRRRAAAGRRRSRAVRGPTRLAAPGVTAVLLPRTSRDGAHSTAPARRARAGGGVVAAGTGKDAVRTVTGGAAPLLPRRRAPTQLQPQQQRRTEFVRSCHAAHIHFGGDQDTSVHRYQTGRIVRGGAVRARARTSPPAYVSPSPDAHAAAAADTHANSSTETTARAPRAAPPPRRLCGTPRPPRTAAPCDRRHADAISSESGGSVCV